MHPSPVLHNPIVIRFVTNSHSILVVASFSFREVAFLQPLGLLFIKFCDAETDTCLQPYNPFLFYRIGTRADANLHNEFACRYPSNIICTVVEQWIHGYFCLGCFSSPTHFHLVKGLARKVWRQCVLVFCARSWVTWRKLQRSPCKHWPFSFHWYQIPFPPSTPMIPFRFFTTAADSIFPCLASKFRKRSF